MEDKILTKLDEIKNLMLLSSKNVLSITEAAEVTHLSVQRIYRLTSTRQIPHYKSAGGRQLYFRKDELENWCLRHRLTTIDEAEELAAARAVGKEVVS